MKASKNVRITAGALTAIIAIISFSMFILAASGTITVTVSDIVTGSIAHTDGLTVSLINCTGSNGSVLVSNITVGGVAVLNISDTANWNYSINVNTTASNTNYVNSTGSTCYQYSDGNQNVNVYPSGIMSINVTIRDIQNQRPIPNANITVWPENNPSDTLIRNYNYNNNYRCSSNVCTTNSSGDILMFAFMSNSTPTNYTVGITSDQYNNINVTADTSAMSEGSSKNIGIVNMTGRGSISGYITDLYNNEPIEGANVSIIEYTVTGEGSQVGYNNTYVYNSLTNSNGYYVIYYPTDLLGATTRYNLKVSAAKYMSIIERNSDRTGYVGSQSINSTLSGLINVSGSVNDISDNQALENVTITITEISPLSGYKYTALTNSTGEFLIKIRNMTNYTLSLTKNGYISDVSNRSGSTNPLVIGLINLTGNSNITGTVVDSFNTSIPLTATVAITQNGRIYTTTSDADGTFLIRIPDTSTYDITAGKAGYFNYTNTSIMPIGGEVNNLGNIEISGMSELVGNIKDNETGRIKRNLENVAVSVRDATNNKTYGTTTDSDGNYMLNISSDAIEFSLSYTLSGFDSKTKNPSSNITSPGTRNLGTTLMVGSTRINGSVTDAYSPIGSLIRIPDAEIKIRNLNSGSDIYSFNTSSSGTFYANLGVTNNYKIIVVKPGYETGTFNNATNGFSANQDISFGSGNYLALNGTNIVEGTVVDAFSNKSVYNAIVKVYKLGYSNETYRRSVNGTFFFRVDGEMTYTVSADAARYPETTLNNNGNGYTSNFTNNITLAATFQAIVRDVENQWGIENATVNLYHHFNQTDYNRTLNETIINMSIACNNIPLNIPVTLNKTACLWYQNASYLGICDRTINTTAGNVIFNTVAIGTYNATIDGSSAGCGQRNETITVTAEQSGTIINLSYSLSNTSAIIKVVDPTNASVSGANISVSSNSSINCTTSSNGECTLNYMPGGSQNVTVIHSNYYERNKSYTITPGVENDLRNNPVIMIPYPGNLTINVTNQSGFVLENINITVLNSTYNISKLTDENGSANFTDMMSYFNITVNGTAQGYNYTNIINQYIAPNDTTDLNATLDENIFTVAVIDGNGLVVNNSNVTLRNISGNTFALSGAGINLTGLTNETGEIMFNRIIPGTYNLTVNASGFGSIYDALTDVPYGLNTLTVALNDTEAPLWNNRTIANTTTNDGLPAVYENETLVVSANWTDNARLSQAVLQLKWPDHANWSNYSIVNLYGVQYVSTFTIQNSFIDAHVGENVTWRIISRDIAGNWNDSMPAQNFSIIDNTAPVITVTTTPENITGSDIVLYTAIVTDNVNVTEINLYVDYTLVANCSGLSTTSTNCTYQSPTPYSPGTKHFYYGVAKDRAGNEGRDPTSKESLVEKTATLSTPARGTAAVFSDSENKVYIIGGYNGTVYLSEIAEYDPATDTITSASTPILPIGAREMVSATYNNATNNITIFGGFNGTYHDDVLSMNTTSNTIANLSALPSARAGTSASFDAGTGYMYVFGGYSSDTNYTNQSLQVTPASNAITTLATDNLVSARYMTSAAYDNQTNNEDIYVFGGYNTSGDIDEIVKFDPSAGAGSRVTLMNGTLPTARRGTAAVYYPPNKNIYIIGGCNGGSAGALPDNSYADIVEYNISADSASLANVSLPSRRCMVSAVYSYVNNTILIFGGFNNDTYYDTILEYTPLTTKQFIVRQPSAQSVLNVTVKDTAGSPIANATVMLNDASWSQTKNTTLSGETYFSPSNGQGTYTLTTTGANIGYANNQTTLNLTEGTNTITITLNTTAILVNVTDNNSQILPNANVSLRDMNGNIVVDGMGNLATGLTNASGLVEFTRVLPSNNYNLTVSKGAAIPPSNSTLLSISAGDNITVKIDPFFGGYYKGALSFNMTLNVTVVNSSDIALNYTRVNIIDPDTLQIVATNLTGDNGVSLLSIPSGTYNITISGHDRGYNDVNFSFSMGKLVFANGTTDSNGEILLLVDGQPGITGNVPGDGYYVRVEAAGYTANDTINDTILRGTYYDEVSSSNPDVNDGLRVNLRGLSKINGTIYDRYCIDEDKTAGCKFLKNANVTVRFHGGSGNGAVRYSKLTDENGTYSFFLSPYTETSTLSDKVNATYDVQVDKAGYNEYDSKNDGTYGQGIALSENENLTYNAQVVGAGLASGYVYVINQSTPISNANVSIINSTNNHTFYTAMTDVNGFFNANIGSLYNYYILVSSVNYVNKTLSTPFTPSKTDFTFYLYPASHGGVLFRVRGDLSEPIENANITMVAPESHNLTTDSTGEALITVLKDYSYNTTTNGSAVGYGVNNTIVKVDEGVQKEVNITLNSTVLNITLFSNTGGLVDGMILFINSSDTAYVNLNSTDSNGNARFRNVSIGTYNITMSGSQSEIYLQTGNANATITTPGAITNANFTLNETRALLAMGLLSNITINNTRTGQSYFNKTDANGTAMFITIPYGNYSLGLNETVFYESGLIPRNNSVVEVTLGENENTTNNYNMAQNISVMFNITNTSNNTLQNVNVTILLNGSMAADALNGANQTGITDSNGVIKFNRTVPTSYADGTYMYLINANETGYGIINRTFDIGLNGTNVSVNDTQLSPMSLAITVRDMNGNVLTNGVNITVMSGASTAQNISGDNLTASNLTDNITFNHLYVGPYTVVINSTTYFNRVLAVPGWTNGTQTVDAIMSERNLTVNVYELRYEYDSARTLLTDDNFTVSLYNQSGIAKNTTGQNLEINTTTGVSRFTGIFDGLYNVSVIPAALYQRTNKSLNTQSDNYTVNVFVRKNETGYINVTTNPTMATVELICGGIVRDTTTSDANGNAMLSINLTICNDTIYVRGSKKGYVANTTGPYSISQQYAVQDVSLNIPLWYPASSPGGLTVSPMTSSVTTYSLTDSQFTAGYMKDLAVGDRFRVKLGPGDYHYISLDELTAVKAKINVTSTLQQVTLGIGEERLFEVTGDALYDFSVKLNAINTITNKATFTIKRYGAEGAELKISAAHVDIDAGSCKFVPLRIKNNGDVNILNIKLLRDATSDCCVVSSTDNIYILQPQEEKDLNIQVCSTREATKGDYQHSLTIISNLLTKSASLEATVTRDYVEVLIDKIEKIEADISSETNPSMANALVSAQSALDKARKYAVLKQFSDAETEIANAEKYLETSGRVGMEFNILLMIIPLVILAFGGYFFFIRRRGAYNASRPVGGYIAPSTTLHAKDVLLREIGNINARLSRIDVSRLKSKEIYYYRRAKEILGDAKMHIEKENFSAARNAIINLEQHLNVLEFSMNPGEEE